MKCAGSFILVVLVLSFAIPSFSQGVGVSNSTAKGCDITGVWIGGSDDTVPYQMVILPIAGDRYSWRAQQLVPYYDSGIPGITDWTGEITRVANQKYIAQGISLLLIPPDWGLGGPQDMDCVVSVMQFSEDCNTLKNVITTYIGYIPWTRGKVPFVTTPDFNYLELWGATSFEESYKRMPTACPSCPFAGDSNSLLRGYKGKFSVKKR
jgi:hypothetical protein